MKILIIAVGVVLLALTAAVVLTDPSPSTLPSRTRRMLGERIANWFSSPVILPSRPLVDIPIIRAEDAGMTISDEYFIVGVELNGESRAYPLNMLSRPDRHVLNDTLGGQPIVVTWCGLCQSPIVFSRKVAGMTLTFLLSGKIYVENMMLRDTETGSDWPQMLGEAIEGPLKGKSLEPIPYSWTDWKTWRTAHPETTVLNVPQTIDYYQRDPERSPKSFEKRYISGLQWGFVHEGKAFSWPLRELAQQAVANDSFAGIPVVIIFDGQHSTITAFDRRVGDADLTFRLEASRLIDEQTSSIWSPVTGQAIEGKFAGRQLKPVAGIISHLRAWRQLHPDSEVRATHPG